MVLLRKAASTDSVGMIAMKCMAMSAYGRRVGLRVVAGSCNSPELSVDTFHESTVFVHYLTLIGRQAILNGVKDTQASGCQVDSQRPEKGRKG